MAPAAPIVVTGTRFSSQLSTDGDSVRMLPVDPIDDEGDRPVAVSAGVKAGRTVAGVTVIDVRVDEAMEA